MRPFALVLLLLMSLSGTAAARMNAGPDLCDPFKSGRSGNAMEVEGQIQHLSAWLENGKGEALGNALLQRGLLYRGKRDWFRAISDFDRAEAEFERTSYPKSNFSGPGVPSARASLLTERGAAYRESGEYDKALHDLDLALQDTPSFSRARIERALTHFRAGRNDRAIDDFNHVIINDFNSIGYDRARAYGLRASAWLDKGEHGHASVDTNSANALSYSRCDEVRDNFCWLYAVESGPLAEVKSGDALAKYWRRDLMRDCSPEVTDRPNLLDSRALTYLQYGEIADARASAEAAVEGDPGDGEKHYMLAMVKEVAGESADAEFARARELGKPGDWERWERQQGTFRKLHIPETLAQQAATIVDEAFETLKKQYAYFAPNRPVPGRSEILKDLSANSPLVELFKQEYSRAAGSVMRPDPGRWPMRVAVLAFEDNKEGSPPNCRSEIVDSVADNVARFNRAVGRTVFAMGTPEKHDILFVIGGPQSVPDLKVDTAMQKVLDAEERQTSEPNDEHFVSFAPLHFTPTEGANLHYRKSDGELIYANIARSWSRVSKQCSVDIVGNLVLAVTSGNGRRLAWSSLSTSERFNLPQKAGFVSQEIEACFLLMDPNTSRDQRGECVRTLAARDREK